MAASSGTQTGAGRQADDCRDGQYSNFKGGGSLGDCQERAVVAGKQSQVKESCQALCL